MASRPNHSAVREGVADRIYEASVIPELWPQILAELVELTGTAWSTLVAAGGARPHWVTSSAEAEEMVQAHFGAFADNLRTSRLLARPYPGFITDYDILTQQEIDAEPVYQELLIPRGYGFGVGTTILPSSGEMIAVHCENLYASGRIRRDVVDLLDGLRPHLARSAMLSARLSFERARGAVETLSALNLAACAVGAAGQVIVVNHAFELMTDFWTTRGGGRRLCPTGARTNSWRPPSA